ncbi:MAG TPA: membrane protein insertase YidC, partial [Pirellulales bacterium]
MEKQRFVLFIVLSVGLLFLNIWLQSVLHPKPPVPATDAQKNAQEGGDKKPDDKKGAELAADRPADAEKPENAVVGANVAEAPDAEPAWFTLGSADPGDNNPYRLLVTLTNEGAAVERIELGSAHYRDMEDRSGYLGHLAVTDPTDGTKGAKINAVGAGTPAAKAGLKVGDVITKCDGTPIDEASQLEISFANTKPDQKIALSINRESQTQVVEVTLDRRPLEVVRPEKFTAKMEFPQPLDVVSSSEHDPFSFLLTLAQVGDNKLPEDKKADTNQKPDFDPPASLSAELDGVHLRNARWKVSKREPDSDTVEFTHAVPQFGLEIVKRYTLAKIDEKNPDVPAYHLILTVEIRNTGDQPRQVAYQLDGPTGLPTEGWWYAYRVSRSWGGVGVRDMVMLLHDKDPAMVSPAQTFAGKVAPTPEDADALMVYAGVDAQYFSSALLPQPQKDRRLWLSQIKPLMVGRMPADQHYATLGDVSCRLLSTTTTLKADKDDNTPDKSLSSLAHEYVIFAGPKKPELLAKYPLGTEPGSPNSLGELIYYGWPIWAAVARPMTHILSFFYSIVGNYGIAIILLTVLVRGCMFPLSRKQALGAQKMQELKPEMDRINEKYKGKPEDKTRAMQELWRKHNYNPMSGCLLALVQLPIFLGLYRSLMVNVELRQSPLFGEAIRWCSNLAAPDMLFYWKDWSFIPPFITGYRGFMSLGPFLNILPIFTVALFIIQQQMFMPPAT